MRNKMVAGTIVAVVLLSVAVLAVLYWYFSPSEVRIVSIDAPGELKIGQLSSLRINLRNNASEDVNVTINVENAFVNEKGESLKGFTILTPNSSQAESNATDNPSRNIQLKPGSNFVDIMLGYQVPGTQKVGIEVYQSGKFADSRTIEINVPKPEVIVDLWNYKGINGTSEIYTVYGNLRLTGKGNAPGVAVNISVINESTNTLVSAVTRTYSLNAENTGSSGPLVVWEVRRSISDPVTGMQTNVFTETYAPIAVIELSKGEPSIEKYLMSPLVVKGRVGDRYKVVVTAKWMDQRVSSEVRIPS